MTQWTIAFDATIAITVKARSRKQAEKIANIRIEEIEKRLPRGRGVSYCVGSAFSIRNDDTGEEILT